MQKELNTAYGRMLMPEDDFVEFAFPESLLDGTADPDLFSVDLSGVYEAVSRQFRGELSRSIRGSVVDRDYLLEEAAGALAEQLEDIWRAVAIEQAKARRVRVALLTAADLGSLERFRSFTGWPLMERIRRGLEDVLRGEGWTDECLENCLISQALDARARQLARMVAQVFEKP